MFGTSIFLQLLLIASIQVSAYPVQSQAAQTTDESCWKNVFLFAMIACVAMVYANKKMKVLGPDDQPEIEFPPGLQLEEEDIEAFVEQLNHPGFHIPPSEMSLWTLHSCIQATFRHPTDLG